MPSEAQTASSSVTDVGEKREALVEGVEDAGLGLVGSELTEEEELGVAGGEEAVGDVLDVGLEVPGDVGVVGDEGGVAVERERSVLPVEELGDEGVSLVESPRGESSDGEVGERVVSVDGGERRIGDGPEVRGPRSTGRGEERGRPWG